MATSQQYSLRWNNYLRHITYAFDTLRTNDDFVDVTLHCEGRKIKAHKVLLSACSGYFKDIFKENPHPHPVIIFKFIKFEDLNSIIEFMYQGEVNVQQECLQSFLQTAELLSVQGLTSEEREKPKQPKSPLSDPPQLQQIFKTIPIRSVSHDTSSVQVGHCPSTQIIPTQPQVTQQQQTIELHPTNIVAATSTPTIQSTTTTIQPAVTSTGKKRKLSFPDDDEVYTTETVEYTTKEEPNIVKTTEMQYLPATVKMDVPEYIECNQIAPDNNTESHEQENAQETSQTVTQYQSEYEILTESEIEQHNAEASEGGASADISLQMGRILNASTESLKTEKAGVLTQDSNLESADAAITCRICERKLQSLAALKRHNASKHSSRLPKHDCKTCNKSFKTKWSLSTHNSRFHRDTRIAKECIKMEFSI